MKAAYFRGDGRIELARVPTPEPGPGEVLLEVAACGVCGSDRKVWRGGRKNIPGHEVAGTVVEAGEGCEAAVGTRVAVYIPMFCGECDFCRRDRQNLCADSGGLLGWTTDGGYAEYMVVPERNALPLLDGVSFAEGVALLDTIGTAGHGVRLSGVEEAESALVIGAGPLGAGAVAVLKAFGVPDVYVIEPSDYRRELAAELGAVPVQADDRDTAPLLPDHPYGADIVVEAAGKLPTVLRSFDLVRPGGTANILGEYGGPVELEHVRWAWMFKDLTVVKSFYFTVGEFAENQEMVRDGRVPASRLTTHEFPLEDIDDAFAVFMSGKGLKVLVRP